MNRVVGQAYAVMLIRDVPGWNHGLGSWLEDCDHSAREQQILSRRTFKAWQVTASPVPRSSRAQGLWRSFGVCCLWMGIPCAQLLAGFLLVTGEEYLSETRRCAPRATWRDEEDSLPTSESAESDASL